MRAKATSKQDLADLVLERDNKECRLYDSRGATDYVYIKKKEIILND